MKWEFKNGLPIYQQIIEILHMRVVNGTYPPGSRIPAVRELAVEAGVNPNTMQRALAQMEQEGLFISWRTSGRTVTEDVGKIEALREKMGSHFVVELFTGLRELGFSDVQIMKTVKDHIEQQGKESLQEEL